MTHAALRSPRLLGFARQYVRRQLALKLDGFHVAGLAAARKVARRQPLLLVANHVAWWDSFLVISIDEALGTEGYALMDIASTRRLPFFARLGALPLDQARPRAGLREAAGLLDRPGRALWIFPQGTQRPPHLRPLAFRRGVGSLARAAPAAAVVPIGIQYLFRDAPGPAAFAAIGEAMDFAAVAAPRGVRLVEDAVGRQLHRIDEDFASATSAFSTVVASNSRPAEQGLGAKLLNRGLAALNRSG